MSLDSLSDLLASASDDFASKAKEARLVKEVWAEVAPNSESVAVAMVNSKRELVLEAKDNCALSELQMGKHKILKAMNTALAHRQVEPLGQIRLCLSSSHLGC